MKKYDVFISYRRDGGDQSAKAIYDRLKDLGYHTFYDIETLRSGAFNQKLYSVIEECNDVLVILSPGALDRCINEDDWVRLEIAHAFQKNKNVVPVLLRGFTFPDQLPEDIEKIRYQGGLQASVDFFDAFVDRLCTFLTSKPGILRKVNKILTLRTLLIGLLLCVLLGLGVWGGYTAVWNRVMGAAYPFTREQKNEVKELLAYVENNMAVMDTMFLEMEEVFTACDDYLTYREENSYNELIAQFNHASDTLEVQAGLLITLSDRLSETLKDSEVDMGSAAALYTYALSLKEDAVSNLAFFQDIMNPDTILDATTLKRIIEIYIELNDLNKESVILMTSELLLPISDTALEEFKADYLPNLYVLAANIDQWSTDQVEIKSKLDSISTQQDKLMNEYSQLIGDNNVDLLKEQAKLTELLVAGGMSETEAKEYVEGIIDKNQAVDNAQKGLEDINKQLEEEKQKLREKIAPQESDDPYLVWSKALRFMTVHMYEDAIDAFQFHLMQVKDVDENAEVYVAAAVNFVNQIKNTGIDYGVIVVGYEPDKAPHDIYKIGDIIVAINGTPCLNFDEFNTLRKSIPDGETYAVTLLRPDESGKLVLTEVNIPANQPLVAFLNLTEETKEE